MRVCTCGSESTTRRPASSPGVKRPPQDKKRAGDALCRTDTCAFLGYLRSPLCCAASPSRDKKKGPIVRRTPGVSCFRVSSWSRCIESYFRISSVASIQDRACWDLWRKLQCSTLGLELQQAWRGDWSFYEPSESVTALLKLIDLYGIPLSL